MNHFSAPPLIWDGSLLWLCQLTWWNIECKNASMTFSSNATFSQFQMFAFVKFNYYNKIKSFKQLWWKGNIESQLINIWKHEGILWKIVIPNFQQRKSQEIKKMTLEWNDGSHQGLVMTEFWNIIFWKSDYSHSHWHQNSLSAGNSLKTKIGTANHCFISNSTASGIQNAKLFVLTQFLIESFI